MWPILLAWMLPTPSVLVKAPCYAPAVCVISNGWGEEGLASRKGKKAVGLFMMERRLQIWHARNTDSQVGGKH